jgi:hypothetical protein
MSEDGNTAFASTRPAPDGDCFRLDRHPEFAGRRISSDN